MEAFLGGLFQPILCGLFGPFSKGHFLPFLRGRFSRFFQLDKRWEAFGSRYLKREGKKTVGYDAAGLEAYYTLMKECGVPEAEALRAIVLLDGANGAQEWRVLLEAMVVYSRFSRMTEDHLYYACSSLFYGQKGWQNAEERKKFAALLEKRVKALKGKKDTSGRTMTVGGKRMPIMEYYCQSYEEMLKELSK